MRQTILILALAGSVTPCVAMAQTAVTAPADPGIGTRDSQPARPGPDAAVAADQGVEALLNLVLRQVVAGQTMTPDGDNAIFTWKRLLKVVIPRSPPATRALSDFVVEARHRAADEQAAGRTVTARELSIFADEAAAMLMADRPDPRATASAATGAAPAVESLRSDAAPAPQTRVPQIQVPGPRAPQLEVPPLDAPRVQANLRPSGDTAAAGSRGDEITSPPAPQTPPAEPRRADAPVKTVSRDAEKIRGPSAPAAPPPAALAPQPADGQPAPERAALAAAALSRGDTMLAMKNITAARSLYEYAANAGNARAAAALAETYDPAFLNRLGVIGPKPDPGLAAEWYRRAAALGDRSAVARLETLRADAGKQ